MFKVLIKNSYNEPLYAYKVIEQLDHYVGVKVYEVSGVPMGAYELSDLDYKELFTCSIKWDGCSHLNFNNPYIHLCGATHWEEFTSMLGTLYKEVTGLIKNFDKDIAE